MSSLTDDHIDDHIDVPDEIPTAIFVTHHGVAGVTTVYDNTRTTLHKDTRPLMNWLSSLNIRGNLTRDVEELWTTLKFSLLSSGEIVRYSLPEGPKIDVVDRFTRNLASHQETITIAMERLRTLYTDTREVLIVGCIPSMTREGECDYNISLLVDHNGAKGYSVVHISGTLTFEITGRYDTYDDAYDYVDDGPV